MGDKPYTTRVAYVNSQKADITVTVRVDGAIKTGVATVDFKQQTFHMKWDDGKKSNLDKQTKNAIRDECTTKALKAKNQRRTSRAGF